MSKPNFADKSQIQPYDATKWNAQDANELKNSISAAYDLIDTLTGTPPSDLNTVQKLAARLNALITTVEGTTPDGDNVVNRIQELLSLFATYPEETNIFDLISAKVPNTRTINGKPLNTDIVLSKNDIALGNVNNTADPDKPISTAQADVNAAINAQLTAIASLAQVRKGSFASLPNVVFGARLPRESALSDGVQTVETSRAKYIAIGNVADLKLFYLNIGSINSKLDFGHSDITIAASLEYPAGTFTPITFNNDTQSSFLLKKNKSIVTDFIPVAIPNGASFWVRTEINVTAGQKWIKSHNIGQSSQEGVVAAGGLLSSGTIANSNGQSFTPSMVLGVTDSVTPSVVCLGDSISAGTGDTSSGTYFPYILNAGLYGRAFLNKYPNVSMNLAGQRLSDTDPTVNPNFKYWLQILSAGTYSVSNLGVNDLGDAGVTIATMQASYIRVWGAQKARGIKVYQTTITPYTASTDGWTTEANQTVKTFESIRVGVNNWLRDGAPMNLSTFTAAATGVAPGADIMRAGSVYHPLTGYFETADIAETSRNSGKWKPNSTADGLHPNAAMYQLLYPAINLNVFK